MRHFARSRLAKLDFCAAPLGELGRDGEAHRAVRIGFVIDEDQSGSAQISSALDRSGHSEVTEH